MKLSILTATFNRGVLLKEIYKSIIKNLSYGLVPEWIIVDDGSTDETLDIVNEFILSNIFTIKYIKQKNNGKMAAINKALEFATGDLIVDCDSDDYFSEKSFKVIKENAEALLKNDKLYAMCFLKQKSKNRRSKRKNI